MPPAATDNTSEVREVPGSAFRLAAGPLKFLAPTQQAAGAPAVTPIEMQLRSPQPIEHWYWGKIVHDMTGMFLRKDVAPIDWCHCDDEIIGFANKAAADQVAGLVVSGSLVPWQEDDKATEVIFKAGAGVPYEASLDWSGPGAVIEQVGEGATVQVNGFAFEGPGYVVRRWPFTSAAVCPYGADPNTKSQFAGGAGAEKQFSTPITKVCAMAEKTKEQELPATTPAAAPEDVKKQARDEMTTELRRFTEAFGPLNGATWFAEGKSFADAQVLFAREQKKTFDAKEAEIVELKEKLAAVNRGETAPVQGSGDDDKKPKKLSDLVKIR